MKRIAAILLLLLFSCSEKKQSLPELLETWQGKVVSFPTNPVFTRYGKDTVDFNIHPSAYTILFYVDSNSCVDCKLKLNEWKQFKQEVDSSGGEVQYLFFIHNKRPKYVRNILRSGNFDWPVCLDQKNELDHLNQFPEDEQFHAFLLDRNFRVLVVGDPMRNLEIRNLYLKHILGMQPDWVKLETTAIVDDPIKDVGEITGNKPVRHSFKIRNTGLSPLIVTDVATTCGCMQYEYDKKPVDSGKELIFTLIYTPKHSGFFSETVLVRCNTNKAIKIILKGKIKPAQQEL